MTPRTFYLLPGGSLLPLQEPNPQFQPRTARPFRSHFTSVFVPTHKILDPPLTRPCSMDVTRTDCQTSQTLQSDMTVECSYILSKLSRSPCFQIDTGRCSGAGIPRRGANIGSGCCCCCRALLTRYQGDGWRAE